jgi:dTDP-4-dehydrorhamnose reductase
MAATATGSKSNTLVSIDMSRILLFGANGQLGQALQSALQAYGEVLIPPRSESDFMQPDAIVEVVARTKPNLIFNAAAYTQVDRAESEPERAQQINADTPRRLAEVAAEQGIPLIHYSTDYVFDGCKPGAYTEEDVPYPLSQYGASKLAGDQAVLATSPRHAVVRTSWVYSAVGANFVKTMLRLGQERDQLRVVDDQYGAPTSAARIAEHSAALGLGIVQGQYLGGLYNLAAAGQTSWHGFAQAILRHAEQAGLPLRFHPEDIIAIPTEDYPLPAVRPKNSQLDCTRLQQTLGITLPDWTSDLVAVMETLLSTHSSTQQEPSHVHA